MEFGHRLQERIVSLPRSYDLSALREAAQRTVNGVSRVTIACVGDSNTAGVGAGDPSGADPVHDDARVGSYPYQLAANLAAATGMTVTRESFWGMANRNNKTDYNLYNPLVSFTGTSWTSGVASLGGLSFMCAPGDSTSKLKFDPTNAVDTFDVWYISNGPLGTFTAYVDGVSAAVTDTSTGSGLQSVQIRTTLGGHELSIANTGASGNIHIVGVDPYDSTTPDIAVWNMGWGGSTVDDWVDTTSAWSPLNALATIAPELMSINLGINHERFGPVDRPYLVYFKQILDTVAATGADLVMTIPFPIEESNASRSRQQSYAAANHYLANVEGAPIIDLQARMGNFDLVDAAGWAGYDHNPIHLSAAGYGVHAQMLSDLLAPSFAGLGQTTDATAAAIMAAMNTPPTSDEAFDINALVSGMKADGDWDSLDALFLFVAQDQQAGLLNWKDLAHPATAVGSITFTADGGLAGNGSSSYVNTNVIPANLTRFKGALNSLGAYVGNNSQIVRGIGCANSGLTNAVLIQARSTGDQFSGAAVSTQAAFGASTDARAWWSINRSGSTVSGFKNGTRVANITPATSTTLPTVPFFVGAFNNNGTAESFSTRNYRALFLGGTITGQAQQRIYRRIQRFMTARGAAV